MLLSLIYCKRFLWLKYIKKNVASWRHKVAIRRRILILFLIIMSILWFWAHSQMVVSLRLVAILNLKPISELILAYFVENPLVCFRRISHPCMILIHWVTRFQNWHNILKKSHLLISPVISLKKDFSIGIFVKFMVADTGFPKI